MRAHAWPIKIAGVGYETPQLARSDHGEELETSRVAPGAGKLNATREKTDEL